MPANSLKDLHNFQQHFEQAAKDGFSAKGVTLYLSREMTDPNNPLPEEFSSVEFQLGASVGTGLVIRGEEETEEAIHYEATLTFRVITLRPEDVPVPEQVIRTRHADLLTEVRAAMLLTEHSVFTNARLPYYQLHQALPQEPLFERDDEFHLDITELTYALSFSIRPDAWPDLP